MSTPSKKKDESPDDFMSRCMGDSVMNQEYPDQKRRTAVCMSRACEDMEHIEAVDFQLKHAEAKTYKYRDPKTNEIFEYDQPGIYRKNGRVLVPAK